MSDYSHLRPEAIAMLGMSDEDRMHQMQSDQWIGYPVAKEVLDRMEWMIQHPKIARMPNLLIVGRTNNGKTQILRRFRELHPASDNLGGEAISVPVVYVQAPAVPDEKRLYADVLNAIFAKYSVRDHPHILLANVKDKFQRIGVKMLIIDELNSLISGSMAKQRQFLTVLKHLSNELQIPIVGAGTEEAVRAIQTDPQLANRFEPALLPRWAMNTDFRRLLASCEQILPLRCPSGLSEKVLAQELWARSEGTIGEVMTLLKSAARTAISSGEERITSAILGSCGYESPSDRKKRLVEV